MSMKNLFAALTALVVAHTATSALAQELETATASYALDGDIRRRVWLAIPG